MDMQQKEHGISIGKNGALVIGTAKITRKSPLYDRLGNPGYLNPRAFAGAELINARFGEAASEAFALAIENAANRLYGENRKKWPATKMAEEIGKLIAGRLGGSQYGQGMLGSRNSNLLALFDACSMLGREPELSVGHNYDISIKVDGINFGYPDDISKYRGEGRDEVYIASNPAQACSAVHLVLGKEAANAASDRKGEGDAEGWKNELKEAIRRYQDAIAFDSDNAEATYLLSGIYAQTGQHGKASDAYKDAFEGALHKGTKAYYSPLLAEHAIHSKDVGRMIAALRAIERDFPSETSDAAADEGPQYVSAREAAQALRTALSKALGK